MQSILQGLKQIVSDFANSSATISYKSTKQDVPTPWYAEWENSDFASVLDNSFTKKCITKIVDSYYGNQLDEILNEASEMTEKAYSDTYNIYKECCNSLRMKDLPKVYITRKIRGINALSVEIKSKKLILISRQFIVRLTQKEQAFIFGHELGHHQQGNLVCHTINGLIKSSYDVSGILGTILDDTLEIPLKHWHRDSEFNADRAGYLCCKDWQTVETLFKKISERKMRYSSIAELYAEHPFVKTRIEKLQNYIHNI